MNYYLFKALTLDESGNSSQLHVRRNRDFLLDQNKIVSFVAADRADFAGEIFVEHQTRLPPRFAVFYFLEF